MNRMALSALAAALYAAPALLAASQEGGMTAAPAPEALLEEVHEAIHHRLHEMHESLEVAKDRLATTGLRGAAATEVLQDLYEANPHAYDCATVDPDGVIVAAAPPEVAYIVGLDISHQEQIQRLQRTREPVVSTAIDTVEGFVGFDLEHPVHDAAGVYLGSVSILTEPDFFGSIIEDKVRRHPVEMWMMQHDGRIIYDATPEEIGRNLFEDEIYAGYASLLAAGREMARSPEGRSSYTFLDRDLKEEVRKELIWTTVELHGTELRLALAYRAGDF